MGTGVRASREGALTMSTEPTLNALTIDVEDYFQVSGFDDAIPRYDWDAMPARVGPATSSAGRKTEGEKVAGGLRSRRTRPWP